MTSGNETDVDVVVLGLGPGGEFAANRLAKAGLTAWRIYDNGEVAPWA